MTDNQLSSVLDKLGAVKDTMTVSRVFGESYQVDGPPSSRLPPCGAVAAEVAEKEPHRAGKAPAPARGSDSA
jgi:hypothetical protein